MLLEIEEKVVSSELFERMFVCDLSQCKGACCVEGDAGAPLQLDEIPILEEILPAVTPYMEAEGIEKINQQGVFYYDDDGDPVTTLVENGACAFAHYNVNGSAKCSIETAYRNGDIDWKKPISCELFPVRIKKFKAIEALNYQELPICNAGCILGEQLSVPLYKFLKEPLIRAFGEGFYSTLTQVAIEMENQKNNGSSN